MFFFLFSSSIGRVRDCGQRRIGDHSGKAVVMPSRNEASRTRIGFDVIVKSPAPMKLCLKLVQPLVATAQDTNRLVSKPL